MEDLATRTIVNGIDVEALQSVVADIVAEPAKADVRFTVATRWTGQTSSRSTVTHYELGGARIDREFTIFADEPLELLGRNTAPNPQELLMAAVNACMTVGYVAGAAARGITLDRIEIETSGALDLRGFLAIDDDVPPGYEQIDYVVRIAGDGTADQFAEIHAGVMKTSPNFYNMSRPIRMNGRLALD
jgi:uncharacterized OsmC-like protein